MENIIKVSSKRQQLVLMQNIAFSTVPKWYEATVRNLYMNIIIPRERNTQERYPLIVWLCGGAFRVVDHAVWIPELMYYAKKGFIVASVEYRTANEAPYPAALLDVKSAIRFLKAHAETYCIDKKRIAVMGESAGGTLAALAGVTGNIKKYEQGDWLKEDSIVHAVVDYYGMTDFLNDPFYEDGREVPSWMLEDFLSKSYTKEEAREASVTSYIDKNTPPFLIFHGEHDGVVPIGQSKILYEKLKKNNLKADFYTIEKAGHGDSCFYGDEVKHIISKYLLDNI